MGTDDAELFNLFSTHLSVHSGLNLFHRNLDVFGEIWGLIPELPNISRRDKTARHQIVFKNVGNPLGVLLVRFLPNIALTYLGWRGTG